MQCDPFDVHELGAERHCVGQNSMPLFFAAVESPTLPRRSARHHHGFVPAGQCSGHVEIGHAIQTHFDHVGDRGIARGSQVGHRLARDGFAQQRTGHK